MTDRFNGIKDDQVTASSSFSDQTMPYYGRLHIADAYLYDYSLQGAGAWVALDQDDQQWIQIDLKTRKVVTSIATQGKQGAQQWVQDYHVLYTDSDVPVYWSIIKDNLGQPMLFDGNTDDNGVKINNFTYAIVARYIRLNPQRWYNLIALRMELFGCEYRPFVAHFDGTSWIDLRLDLPGRSTQTDRDEVRFRFRTREVNGLLLYGDSSQLDYFCIELYRGRLRVNVNLGAVPSSTEPTDNSVDAGSLLDDDQWHDVHIIREQKNLNISVDRIQVWRNLSAIFVHTNMNRNLSAGGLPHFSNRRGITVTQNFKGCIEEFVFNGVHLIRDAQHPSGVITVLPHDAPDFITVDGYQAPGSYRRKLVYDRADRETLGELLSAGGLPHFSNRRGITVTQNFKGCIEEFVFNGVHLIRDAQRSLLGSQIVPAQDAATMRWDEALGYPKRNPFLWWGPPLTQNQLNITGFAIGGSGKLSTTCPPVTTDDSVIMFPGTKQYVVFLKIERESGAGTLQFSFQFRTLNRGGIMFYHTVDKDLNYISLSFDRVSYIGGGRPQRYGFQGCMRTIRVSSVDVVWNELEPAARHRSIINGSCLIQDRCSPNPCKHEAPCYQNGDTFFCDCTNTGYSGAVCHQSEYFTSCSEAGLFYALRNPFINITIDMDGSGVLQPIKVTCDFTGQLDDLPVMEVRFGDTGGINDDKFSRYNVGPLRCFGDTLFDNTVTFRKADANLELPPLYSEFAFDMSFMFRTTITDAVIMQNNGRASSQFFEVRIRKVGGTFNNGPMMKILLDRTQDRLGTVEEYIQVGFKTKSKRGILMEMRGSGDTNYIIVKVNNNGGITIEFDVGFKRFEVTTNYDIDLCNDQHHMVHAWRTDMGTKWHLKVDDYNEVVEDFSSYLSPSADVRLDDPWVIFMGRNDTMQAADGFDGCIYAAQWNNFFPLRMAFQDPRLANVQMLPANSIREDLCGFIEILPKPEPLEIRPSPAIPPNITPPAQTDDKERERRIVAGVVTGLLLILTVIALVLFCRHFTIERGDYETKEAKDASHAKTADMAIQFGRTGQPEVDGKGMVDDYNEVVEDFSSYLSPSADVRLDDPWVIFMGRNDTMQAADGFDGCIYAAQWNNFFPLRMAFQDPRLANVQMLPAIVTGLLLILTVIALVLFCRHFTIERGDYETKEAKDASHAKTADMAIQFGRTGQPEVDGKEWWL
ncbi:hypothetical protein AHF37_03539 [Paragonimus kellicotti]|nr:hypothetical protein AHF37_03539 [Paragonimus kellicotti]